MFSKKKRSCVNNKKTISNNAGTVKESLSFVILTFSIITTKRKSTAIAPTYIIIKTTAKNSTRNKKRMIADAQKVTIKKRIECTGLCKKITIKPLTTKRKRIGK